MSGASRMHYWVQRDDLTKKMRLDSDGVGVVCALCGVAFHAPERTNLCPEAYEPPKHPDGTQDGRPPAETGEDTSATERAEASSNG